MIVAALEKNVVEIEVEIEDATMIKRLASSLARSLPSSPTRSPRRPQLLKIRVSPTARLLTRAWPHLLGELSQNERLVKASSAIKSKAKASKFTTPKTPPMRLLTTRKLVPSKEVAVVDAEVEAMASDATTVAVTVVNVATVVTVVETVAVIESAEEAEARDLSWTTKRRNQPG